MTHPEDLHIFIDLSLQEANFLVTLCVSAEAKDGKSYSLYNVTHHKTLIYT